MTSKTIVRVVLAVLLLSTLACGRTPEEIPVPPSLTVHLETQLVLGEDPGTQAGLLGAPRGVRTDHAGRIYVADVLAMGVKLFDSEGRYLRTIGDRGRETGQFLGINAMHVDSSNELLVIDGTNQRITRFGEDDRVVASRSLDSDVLLWPREIKELAPRQYLLSYKLPDEKRREGRRNLFHVFDESFSKPSVSFGNIKDYGDSRDPVVNTLSQVNPGSFTLTADGAVLYAPFLYRGRIHRYEADRRGWSKTESFRGYVQNPEPFVRVDPYQYDAKTLNFNSTSSKGKLAANFNNESRGLFVLERGDIVHFTFISIDDRRVFGVELFDARGNLQGYGEIASVARPGETGVNLALYAEWKDDQDRFYLRDETDLPVVRVVRLRWQEEAPEPLQATLELSD